MEALTTLFRAGDADQQAEFSVPFFRAFVASLALPLSRACSSPFFEYYCKTHNENFGIIAFAVSQVSVALRFQDANSPNLHMRVLQGVRGWGTRLPTHRLRQPR